MIIVDGRAFDDVTRVLRAVAVHHCRTLDGLLVRPPGKMDDSEQYRAIVRAALTALYNAPVQASDEVTIHPISRFTD